MGSHGIKDQVAIVGMGCTPFGEHWNKSTDDLLIDASEETLRVGGHHQGRHRRVLARHRDVGHERHGARPPACSCTTSRSRTSRTSARRRRKRIRNAAYAVASGAYDVAMAIGVEKVKDSGYQGLVGAAKTPTDGTGRTLTAAAMFAMCAPGYGKKYGVDNEQMREVLARIAWKNHYNGARNPRAQFKKEVSMETITNAPLDGRRPRCLRLLGRRRRLGRRDHRARRRRVEVHGQADLHQGAVARRRQLLGQRRPRVRLHDLPRDRGHRTRRVRAGRRHQPREQIAMAEVHDCFTPAELLIYEDLQFAERGSAWKEVLAGTFDLKGDMPVNPDGGLKSFGHPVGASGLRMMFEAWLQLRGKRPQERTIGNDRKLALTHNLGGYPGEMVSFVSILGNELG